VKGGRADVARRKEVEDERKKACIAFGKCSNHQVAGCVAHS
jgi:hypothetical protein